MRSRSIDTTGWISRRPTAHVAQAHDDLRALVGWHYSAVIGPDRTATPVPNEEFSAPTLVD